MRESLPDSVEPPAYLLPTRPRSTAAWRHHMSIEALHVNPWPLHPSDDPTRHTPRVRLDPHRLRHSKRQALPPLDPLPAGVALLRPGPPRRHSNVTLGSARPARPRSSPEPIWRRSPCGSDTQAPPSPTNTSRQTSRPRKPCYNTSTTPVPHQHVSSPTTNSSPSSKTCDYVQRLPVDRRPQRGPPTGLHITMDWAE